MSNSYEHRAGVKPIRPYLADTFSMFAYAAKLALAALNCDTTDAGDLLAGRLYRQCVSDDDIGIAPALMMADRCLCRRRVAPDSRREWRDLEGYGDD